MVFREVEFALPLELAGDAAVAKAKTPAARFEASGSASRQQPRASSCRPSASFFRARSTIAGAPPASATRSPWIARRGTG